MTYKKPFLNRALRILLATNSAILIAGAMFAPIYALFVEEIGGSILDASFTGMIFALAAGITTLLVGKYTDQIKEGELVVVAGYSMMGFAFILMTIVNSIATLLVVQALIGFAEAFYSPAFDGIYSKHIPKNKHASSWGAWESMNYFVTAFGALLGGYIVFIFNFDMLFLIMGLLCFGSALYIYRLPRKVL